MYCHSFLLCPGYVVKRGFWTSLLLVLIVGLCLRQTAGVVRSPKSAKINPIFEKEHYEIKSCLSADLETHEKSICRFFAVVVDAGSTGTRMHIFEFSHDNKRPASPFKLENEYFEEVKPGLSHFGRNAHEAADSVEPLLQKAKAIVPPALYPHTPLTLKATAGLRLLSSAQAEAILNAIEELFEASPFLLNEESVSIMSGTDEGIFGWFTLNFLIDRIDAVLQTPQELSRAVTENLTAAALDLGGGSTQVTFRPLRPSTLHSAPPDHVKEIRVFGQDVKLYTHSYLGNGILATRLEMLRASTRGKAEDFGRLYTNCMPGDFALVWNYSGNAFAVRGMKHFSFDGCLADARRHVATSLIDAPPELKQRDIYAFGYFFDRGAQGGLASDETLAEASVAGFRQAAKQACSHFKMGPEHWRPWQCLDLTYIYALLADGYRLPDDKTIHLAKKFRGMETSWALGAAYHLLNTYHEQQNRESTSDIGAYGRFCYYFCSRLFHGIANFFSYMPLLA